MAPGSLLESYSSSRSNESQLSPLLCQIITPIGMLGYGFDEDLSRKALLEMVPNRDRTALILDSGSTDSGPLKLATGATTAPRTGYRRDLGKLLALNKEFHVPIIIASAGGDGSDTHVDELLDIVNEICEEDNRKIKALAVYSGVPKSRVLRALNAGEVKGCGISVPALTEDDIKEAVTIVAQMGPEPFIDAMAASPDFDIIIGGRAYDPSPYIAYCVHKLNMEIESIGSSQLGGYTFMGKIMECGAQCGTPKSASAKATIYRDGTFDVVPLSEESRCTPVSVAAHTLYEKTRPDVLPGPGGNLILADSSYEQLGDNRTVRVRGAAFEVSPVYTVKLEAAKTVGYRSMIMGGIRDPILIKQMDDFLVRVKDYVQQQHKGNEGMWEMEFHVYGANGIMGALEPGSSSYLPREVFLVGEALATSQTLATSVANTARIACVHGPYPGQRATSGNFAMGVGGKLEIEMGPCAEFCIYHLIPLGSGEERAHRIGSEEGVDGLQTKPLFTWKSTSLGKEELVQGEVNGISNDILIKKKTSSPSMPVIPPTQLNLEHAQTLCDIAPVIRSKNAGPYEITIDVIFSSRSIYKLVKSSNLLNTSVIARLYHLKEEEIVYCGFYDQAMAWKATIPRKGRRKGVWSVIPGGGYMEADVHGSQQYVGLLELPLPEEIKSAVGKIKLV